jgi:hypothetical protein
LLRKKPVSRIASNTLGVRESWSATDL